MISPRDPDALAAALLHDVIENTAITGVELRTLTGDSEAVRLVEVLTRQGRGSERDYLFRCGTDPVAFVIKQVGLEDKLLGDDSAVASAVAQDIRREAMERLTMLNGLSPQAHP